KSNLRDKVVAHQGYPHREFELAQHRRDFIRLVETHHLSTGEEGALDCYRVGLTGHDAAPRDLFLRGDIDLAETRDGPREHESQILAESVEVDGDAAKPAAQRRKV